VLLSYSFRLLCLALLAIGGVQAVAELGFWLASPRLLKMLAGSGARRQEQVLFWGQLVTHALALALTLVFLVPRYVEAETNLDAERVGWLSAAAAALVLCRYIRALQHGIEMWARAIWMLRFCDTAEPVEGPYSTNFPLMSVAQPCPPLAVVGLVRPRILIAKSMLDRSKLSAEALGIALDHEQAHLRHRDNWKLFALACLPSLGLHTKMRPACLQLWRRHNDWAADDDAVRGDYPRALTLAESLVACSKSIPAKEPGYLFTGLATHEDELKARIERLIGLNASPQPKASNRFPVLLALAGVLLAVACSLLAAAAPWLHETAESILHLG
jgi:hypothetical protein